MSEARQAGEEARDDGMPGDRIELNGKGLGAIALLSSFSYAGFFGIPFAIPVIVEDFGVSNAQAGLLQTFEMGGVLLGGIVGTQLAALVRARPTYAWLLAGIMAACLLVVVTHSLPALYFAGLVIGVSAGTLKAIAMATVGRSTTPQKSTGVVMSVIALMSIMLGLVLPQAIQFSDSDLNVLRLSSVDALYMVFLLFALISLPLVPIVPQAPRFDRTQTDRLALGALPGRGWLALLAMTVMFFGWASMAPFFISIGVEQLGLSYQTAGLVFLGGNALAVATPLIATAATRRIGSVLPAVAIVVAVCTFGAVVTHSSAPIHYMIAGPLLMCMALPFVSVVVGALGRIDDSGRQVAIYNSFMMIGAAVGPIAGGLVSSRGDFANIIWILGPCAVIAVLLAIPALRQADRTGRS